MKKFRFFGSGNGEVALLRQVWANSRGHIHSRQLCSAYVYLQTVCQSDWPGLTKYQGADGRTAIQY